MKNNVSIVYQEAALEEVIKFYAEHFHVGPYQRLLRTESFLDSVKGVIVFKLTLEDVSKPK